MFRQEGKFKSVHLRERVPVTSLCASFLGTGVNFIVTDKSKLTQKLLPSSTKTRSTTGGVPHTEVRGGVPSVTCGGKPTQTPCVEKPWRGGKPCKRASG